MHAVVTRSTIHDMEQARTFLREEGVPRISQAPGFVAAQFVRLDESTGTAMLTFESEEAAQAAAEQLKTNPPAGSYLAANWNVYNNVFLATCTEAADAVTINSIEIGEVVERA